jgi:hypothetical protein
MKMQEDAATRTDRCTRGSREVYMSTCVSRSLIVQLQPLRATCSECQYRHIPEQRPIQASVLLRLGQDSMATLKTIMGATPGRECDVIKIQTRALTRAALSSSTILGRNAYTSPSFPSPASLRVSRRSPTPRYAIRQLPLAPHSLPRSHPLTHPAAPAVSPQPPTPARPPPAQFLFSAGETLSLSGATCQAVGDAGRRVARYAEGGDEERTWRVGERTCFFGGKESGFGESLKS